MKPKAFKHAKAPSKFKFFQKKAWFFIFNL